MSSTRSPEKNFGIGSAELAPGGGFPTDRLKTFISSIEATPLRMSQLIGELIPFFDRSGWCHGLRQPFSVCT